MGMAGAPDAVLSQIASASGSKVISDSDAAFGRSWILRGHVRRSGPKRAQPRALGDHYGLND